MIFVVTQEKISQFFNAGVKFSDAVFVFRVLLHDSQKLDCFFAKSDLALSVSCFPPPKLIAINESTIAQ